MKKALFASTALVAASVAGASFADVKLSGSAEMGLMGGTNTVTQFHTDMDVSFNLSGDTGNGLTFGAKIDLDEVSNGIGSGNIKDVVWIKGSFGTLTLGDTDGAFDKVMQDVGMGSALTDDHTSHAGYSGNAGFDGWYDGEILRYDYSFGDIAFAVSAEMDDNGNTDPVLGLGLGWGGDFGGTGIKVGLGYQTVNDGGTHTVIGASVGATMGAFQAVVNYSVFDYATGTSTTHMAIALGYTMGDMLLTANYGVWDYDSGSDDTGYGVAMNYALGGGASAQLGYGVSDSGGPETNTFSAGLAFSF